MKQLHYTIRLTTPVFLGNAEQNAQWRTPPIKALLRQWWRVAFAAQHRFNVDIEALRRAEGKLFGNAWLEDEQQPGRIDARKSQVRLRLLAPQGSGLQAWGMGSQSGVSPLSTDLATSYAWFGLVRRGNGLPDRQAISSSKSGEMRRELLLAVPENHASELETTARLIKHFGQLGSRSRGGWGSFDLEGEGLTPLSLQDMQGFAQKLSDCLRHDWPMSLCTDEKGLCLWSSSRTFQSWDLAMRAAAAERKRVRSLLKTAQGKDLRPLLGFASPGRMPSPLRWRVVPAGSGQLRLRVWAMPTLIPGGFMNPEDQLQGWQQVFRSLDDSQHLKRGL